MTPHQVLESLEQRGIKLEACEGKIKVIGQPNQEQLELIRLHKQVLLEIISGSASQVAQTVEQSPAKDENTAANNIYKTYQYKNGCLSLTEEEFNNVVEAFRLLLEQKSRSISD